MHGTGVLSLAITTHNDCVNQVRELTIPSWWVLNTTRELLLPRVTQKPGRRSQAACLQTPSRGPLRRAVSQSRNRARQREVSSEGELGAAQVVSHVGQCVPHPTPGRPPVSRSGVVPGGCRPEPLGPSPVAPRRRLILPGGSRGTDFHVSGERGPAHLLATTPHNAPGGRGSPCLGGRHVLWREPELSPQSHKRTALTGWRPEPAVGLGGCRIRSGPHDGILEV